MADDLGSGDDFVGYATPTANLCKVEPGLFIGTFMTEQNEALLSANSITHILQVGSELLPSHPSEFKYVSINCSDNAREDLLRVLRPCLEFIDTGVSAGGNVLVHCMAGVSRSPAVCCAYVMWKHRCSLDAALERITSVRPEAQPNPVFMEQLKAFETDLRCDVSKLPDTPVEAIANLAGTSGEIGLGVGHHDEDSDVDNGLTANLCEADWM